MGPAFPLRQTGARRGSGLARRLGCLLASLATASSAAGPPLAAGHPHASSVTVLLGAFNIGHNVVSGGAGVELALGQLARQPLRTDRLWVRPIAGLGGSGREAVYGYAGARADLDLPRHWQLAGSFAVSVYSAQDDIDLGGPVNFRSSFEVRRAFENGVGFGVGMFHISNGRLYSRNPGTNQVSVVMSFPLTGAAVRRR